MHYFLASKIAYKNSGVIQEIIRDIHSVEEKELNFAGLNGFYLCPKGFLCPFKK